MMRYDDLFRRYLKPLAPIPTNLRASGRIKDPVRAVLFDIYGTLFISGSGGIGTTDKTAGSIPVLEELIRSHGLECSPEALVRSFSDAIAAEHARMKSRGIDYPEVEIDRIWSEVLGIYDMKMNRDMEMIRRFAISFELIVNPVWPMPHLNDLITACRGAGLTIGIISNAQFYTPLLFHYFCGALPENLGFPPELIVYSYVFGRAKPSPVLFEAAAKMLRSRQISPEHTLYIGNDMRNDICAARAVGFQTALYAGDARSLRLRPDDPCCSDLAPDLYITDLKQLPGHFRNPGISARKPDPD